MDPNDIAALIKADPGLIKEAYGDLASGSFREAGKLGVDILKVIRLCLLPVQALAALQDRLEGYINRSLRNVPEEQRILPVESILLPIAEKLRFQEPDSPITQLYINLLSRAMDGERVNEAHPAFIILISQLAPDEVVFLQEMSKNEYAYVLKINEEWHTPSNSQINELFGSPDGSNVQDIPELLATEFRLRLFHYESLIQPDLFYVFLEHLMHLGLIEFRNDASHRDKIRDYFMFGNIPKLNNIKPQIFVIRLTAFGKLFIRACTSQAQ